MARAFKILLALFAVANAKSLPLAYLFRFYLTTIKTVLIQKAAYAKTGKNTYGITAENDKLAAFTPVRYSSYVSPMELDFNLHKSNSTYFIDLDMGRTEMLCKVLQKAFFSYINNERGEFKKASLGNAPYIPLGSVDCKFKKELSLFQKYDIVSKIIAWDEKWLFVLSKFVVKSGKTERVHAIAITKYVVKFGRTTVPPEEMLERAELLTEEAKAENAKHIAYFKYYVDLETVDDLCAKF